jgi:hypothetical protein
MHVEWFGVMDLMMIRAQHQPSSLQQANKA